MKIEFREFNPFDLWIWIEFPNVPSPMEQQYLEELFNSWFYVGKLGGYNAENLQIQDMGIDISYMEYDEDTARNSLMSPMHNMSDFQYSGNWGRCWFDLGTSDLICLDILINSLRRMSEEFVDIGRIIIGGENSDWPVDERNGDRFAD
ncbi:MAG: hypothetical protein N5P05_001652 [Chroococcopsis gigantea SAG 12.99]|jgi:hypothetical protein|nr:hypothetical protein [Chroococcopsis gigantea SAG 12.99]